MKKLPLIKSVMTPFPYSVDARTPLHDAIRYLREHDIHHLPVTDGEELIGVLHGEEISGHPESCAGDLVRGRPQVVDLNDRLDEVLIRMAREHISTLLVTRNGKLAGIFTSTDACRLFAEFLREDFRHSGGDDAA